MGEHSSLRGGEAQPGCRASFWRTLSPSSPRSQPFNSGRVAGQRQAAAGAHSRGVDRMKSNEIWEMFLGAFKSSLHVTEFDWAAAAERVGGELGKELGWPRPEETEFC